MAFATVQEELLFVDKEISRLEASLVNLKRRRNAIVPVSRLPTDILPDIFAFCRDAELDDAEPVSWATDTRETHGLGWTQVADVCSLWRSVALSSYHLWSRLSLRGPISPGRVETILGRSGFVPLTIELRNLKDQKSGQLILQELYRIEELRIHNCGFVLGANLTLLEQPAPILHTLRITEDGGDDISVPDRLFNNDAPSLRVVQMSPLPEQWTAGMLGGTDIHVLDIGFDAFDPFRFYDAICHFRTLRSLAIRVGDITEVPDDTGDILFADLVDFTFSGNLDILSMLSAHTRMPKLEKLVIKTQNSSNEEGVYRTLGASLATLHRNSHPLLFSLNHMIHVVARDSFTLVASGANTKGLTELVEINIDGGDPSSTWLSGAPHLLRPFMLSGSETSLFLDCRGNKSSMRVKDRDWETVINGLGSLQPKSMHRH